MKWMFICLSGVIKDRKIFLSMEAANFVFQIIAVALTIDNITLTTILGELICQYSTA